MIFCKWQVSVDDVDLLYYSTYSTKAQFVTFFICCKVRVYLTSEADI